MDAHYVVPGTKRKTKASTAGGTLWNSDMDVVEILLYKHGLDRGVSYRLRDAA